MECGLYSNYFYFGFDTSTLEMDNQSHNIKVTVISKLWIRYPNQVLIFIFLLYYLIHYSVIQNTVVNNSQKIQINIKVLFLLETELYGSLILEVSAGFCQLFVSRRLQSINTN